MEGTPSQNNPESGDHHRSSSAGLMSSAKVLGDAAQSAVSKKSVNEVDKAKVAGAAEDLLGSAQQYGHVDEKSNMGQYINKAEGYLHKVHSSGGTTTTATGATTTTTAESGGGGGEEVRKESTEEKSGGGMGDYVTMAKGFLGK